MQTMCLLSYKNGHKTIIFIIVKHKFKLTVQNKYYKQHIFITMKACERVTEIWKPWMDIYICKGERERGS